MGSSSNRTPSRDGVGSGNTTLLVGIGSNLRVLARMEWVVLTT